MPPLFSELKSKPSKKLTRNACRPTFNGLHGFLFQKAAQLPL
jgi:hypothetical protein